MGQTQVFLVPVEPEVSEESWCIQSDGAVIWQSFQEPGLQQGNQAIVSHVGLSVGEGGVIGFVGSWMVMSLLLPSCWGCSGHPRPLHASKDMLGRTCVLLGYLAVSTQNWHTQTGSTARAQQCPTGRLGWTLQDRNIAEEWATFRSHGSSCSLWQILFCL